MSGELKMLPCPACGFTGKNHYINLQSNSYSIKCSTCGLETGIEHTLQDVVDAWNSIPRALTWTTEPPKEPGWYFVLQQRPRGGKHVFPVWWDAIVGEPENVVRRAGPIPMPKEPTP